MEFADTVDVRSPHRESKSAIGVGVYRLGQLPPWDEFDAQTKAERRLPLLLQSRELTLVDPAWRDRHWSILLDLAADACVDLVARIAVQRVSGHDEYVVYTTALVEGGTVHIVFAELGDVLPSSRLPSALALFETLLRVRGRPLRIELTTSDTLDWMLAVYKAKTEAESQPE